MSRAVSPVDQVMGRLFERSEDDSRNRAGLSHNGGARAARSARQPSVSRMARVGAPHGKAIFKLVRRGGAQDRSGLKGQMKYVFNDDKLARVIDPSGRVDSHGAMQSRDMDAIIGNWSRDWWRGTRNGHTSHMIFSYPKETSIDQVDKITRGVLEEMFNSGDARFKYVAGIHDDTEHHPHAHVIVNRRASDNSLFHMRSGTEYSYEGFREAMAAHAARHGIFLDPTFRFERGVTDKQPIREEQLKAQLEQRAPVQRPRVGADLEYTQELISFSKIAYEAMSVIAYNADCPRLEAAYERLAQNLENEGDFTMPELSQDELQRFEEYTAILNETITRTETMLASRDAASRAPYEKELSQMMKSFTDISPNAPYAKDLHQDAASNSIYVHSLGENGDALRSAETQRVFEEIERDYGLDAAALSARLEIGAENNHLEQMWIRNDVQTLAEHEGLDLSKQAEMNDALERTSEAYAVMRAELVSQRVLEGIPDLDPGYERDGQSANQEFDMAHSRQVLEDLERGVKENFDSSSEYSRFEGLIMSSSDLGTENQQLETAGEYVENLERLVSRADDMNDTEKSYLAALPALVDRDEAQLRDALEVSRKDHYVFARFEDGPTFDPEKAQQEVDRMVNSQVASLDSAITRIREMYDLPERERDLEGANTDPFEQYIARSQDNYSLTDTRAEMDDLHKLIRDHTTDDEYEALRRGELKGAERITADPVFARQLAIAVEEHQRGEGHQFDREAENRFTEHREYLDREFEADREHDHGRER